MNNNEMTVEGTIRELRFALEHGMDFTKHRVPALLNKCQVKEVCDELGIRADLHASFMDDYNGQPCRGYYVLSFWRGGENGSQFGTYFGVDLVTKREDYTIEPDEEDEE